MPFEVSLHGAQVFLDAAVIDLHVQIDARRAESAKEKERKERLEYRLQKLRASVDFMKVEIQARTTHLSAGVGEIGNLKSKSGQQNPPSDHAIIRVLGDELTRQVPHKSTSHGTFIYCLIILVPTSFCHMLQILCFTC